MSNPTNDFPRGSEWRRWDLHVHTPASRLGNPFPGISWDQYCGALDKAISEHEIAVVGITDYMSIDGYEYLAKVRGAGTYKNLTRAWILPNIEFRSVPNTKGGNALNVHLLVDTRAVNHIDRIKGSLRNLKFAYKGQQYGCVRAELIAFARAQRPELEDEEAAYAFGIEQFKPPYKDIFSWRDSDAWLKENSVLAIANGKDGISGLPLDSFAAIRDEILCQSDFVFSGNPADRQHYLGLKPGYPADLIVKQYKSLKPCFHGSDAHDLDHLFAPDFKRYCWLKADPTFSGLRQAILEPEKRTFIGERPQKLVEVEANKTYFIDRITVDRDASAGATVGEWMDGCELKIGRDLVAIIGNKGSGKSALADIVALLGNSRQYDHFSFLKKDRFRGKAGEPAKHFVGTLHWEAGPPERRKLSENPLPDKAELIKYIPQGHFEELCNDHITGRSNSFERELRSVIFAHASDEIRLGSLDFDQLVQQQERALRDELGELRKDLKKVNDTISSYEDQSQPTVRRTVLDLLNLKNSQIEEHQRIKPTVAVAPSAAPTEAQAAIATALQAAAKKMSDIDLAMATRNESDLLQARKIKSVQTVRDRLRLLERGYEQFLAETKEDLEYLGLAVADVVEFKRSDEKLDAVIADANIVQSTIRLQREADSLQRSSLEVERASQQALLDEPNQRYQQSLALEEQWAAKFKELVGSPGVPDSRSGLQERIRQLDELPGFLRIERERRLELTKQIFDVLDAQRKAREKLFAPVQNLIQTNALIRDEYKLQFRATLSASHVPLATTLFALIKQNTGEFRGEDESFLAIQKLIDDFDLDTREGTISFVAALESKIRKAASATKEDAGISSLLRKDKTASDVYDLVFGLDFLSPRYSLLFQDTQIEQLSPGQRGALLLIFYLLVDIGRTPIILDQPEENLDNETVVSLLVPVLTEAKKRRQILMVTHNPNLAVVCDAEQVIYSSFDRKNDSQISYFSGSIENSVLNKFVIDVLEGTKPAFNNRRVKYH